MLFSMGKTAASSCFPPSILKHSQVFEKETKLKKTANYFTIISLQTVFCQESNL
jgi:hypothetical protein